MFRIPVTYFFSFGKAGESLRPYLMHEFAVNGAKHLVLANDLIGMIMQDHTVADRLRKDMADEGLSFLDAHSPFGVQLPWTASRVNRVRRTTEPTEFVASSPSTVVFSELIFSL